MQIVKKQEQSAAVIRARMPVTRMSEELARGYGEIMEELGKQGIAPTGAPFAVYHNMDMNDLDVEMGFPVPGPVASAGRMTAGKLPSGPTAMDIHKGPYNTIERTYKALSEFIAKKGSAPRGVSYEIYLSDPAVTPQDNLLTEVCIPLAH